MHGFTAPLALTAGLALGTLVLGPIATARADSAASAATLTRYELKVLPYEFAQLQNQTSAFIQVDCTEGKKILGGGAELRDAENRVPRDVRLVESGPIGETAWIAAIVPMDGAEAFPATGTFKTKANCATAAE